MNPQTMLNSSLIIAGAVVMLVSIVKSFGLLKTLPFVAERHRKHIWLYLTLHRALMAFFLVGYLVVLAAFVFHLSFIGETIIGLIFLFGAIFVLVGIMVQSRLLSEIQNTLQGILPICCKCKKIRTDQADAENPKAWRSIEDFISEKTNVGFSHGYCPECYKQQLMELKK